MRATGFQLALYVVAVLPLLLVAISSSAWWQGLPHPWIFVAAGTVCLYLLLAVLVVAVIFVGPGFGGYVLEAPGDSSDSGKQLPIIEITAVVIFVALGGAILWALRQWQL